MSEVPLYRDRQATAVRLVGESEVLLWHTYRLLLKRQPGSSLSTPVDPSFRALCGRPEFFGLTS
jgi:hypothetical protein